MLTKVKRSTKFSKNWFFLQFLSSTTNDKLSCCYFLLPLRIFVMCFLCVIERMVHVLGEQPDCVIISRIYIQDYQISPIYVEIWFDFQLYLFEIH